MSANGARFKKRPGRGTIGVSLSEGGVQVQLGNVAEWLAPIGTEVNSSRRMVVGQFEGGAPHRSRFLCRLSYTLSRSARGSRAESNIFVVTRLSFGRAAVIDIFSQTPMLSGEICKLTEAPYLLSRIRISTVAAPPKSATSGGLGSDITYRNTLNAAGPSWGSSTSGGWLASTTSAGSWGIPALSAPTTLW